MFTVCPKCALTLVVTAADLRVAQGYVRCGRCLNVFNALVRLSEERPGAGPAAPPDAADTTTEAPPSLDESTGEIEIELDPSVLVTSAVAPSEQSAAAKAPAEAAPAAPSAPTEAAPPSGSAPQTNTTPPPADNAFELVALRAPASLAWRLGAGALVLILTLQIANHCRDALAAHPALRGPLGTVYSLLGVKLAPRWDVGAYDVRQLGASAAGATPGEIIVRASVKNGASRPQPLPLLRVTLQDRFGNRIAARDVPPRDYLPSSVAPTSLLAAGSRVDATMVFVDPGPQAAGFEIDACLPFTGARTPARPGLSQSGAVACAHGP